MRLALWFMLAVLPTSLAAQWTIQTNKDKMTDEVSIGVATLSTDAAAPEKTLITLWCTPKEGLSMVIMVDEYLGDYTRVQYRFDADPASAVIEWPSSGQYAMAPDSLVGPITKRALTASRIVIRVNEGSANTFDLDGTLRRARNAQRVVGRHLLRSMSDSLTFERAFAKLPCGR